MEKYVYTVREVSKILEIGMNSTYEVILANNSMPRGGVIDNISRVNEGVNNPVPSTRPLDIPSTFRISNNLFS